MNINTKFKLGQEVYIIFKEDNEPYVKIMEDIVKEIVISDTGVAYYCDKLCEEFFDYEMVNKKDITGLIPKIKELLKEDNNKQEENCGEE